MGLKEKAFDCPHTSYILLAVQFNLKLAFILFFYARSEASWPAAERSVGRFEAGQKGLELECR